MLESLNRLYLMSSLTEARLYLMSSLTEARLYLTSSLTEARLYLMSSLTDALFEREAGVLSSLLANAPIGASRAYSIVIYKNVKLVLLCNQAIWMVQFQLLHEYTHTWCHT